MLAVLPFFVVVNPHCIVATLVHIRQACYNPAITTQIWRMYASQSSGEFGRRLPSLLLQHHQIRSAVLVDNSVVYKGARKVGCAE